MHLTNEELAAIIAEAYREGYKVSPMVEAGLESYNPNEYARWIVHTLITKK